MSQSNKRGLRGIQAKSKDPMQMPSLLEQEHDVLEGLLTARLMGDRPKRFTKDIARKYILG